MHPKRLEQNQLTEKAAHDKQEIVDIIAMGALPKKHGGTCHKRTLSHNMFATKTTTSNEHTANHCDQCEANGMLQNGLDVTQPSPLTIAE